MPRRLNRAILPQSAQAGKPAAPSTTEHSTGKAPFPRGILPGKHVTLASQVETLIEIVGWVAAALILLGYGLVTSGRITASSRAYHLLNIVGAIGFIINSGWNGAKPSVGLNVVWLGIGIFGLLRLRRKGTGPDGP